MRGLYTSFIDHLIEPTYDLLRGTTRHELRKELKKTQWLTRIEIEEIQCRNLRAIIKHAYNTVPYYHRLFNELRISPDDIRGAEDLHKLPILRKQDINQHFNDLISTTIPKRQLVPYQSGGSGDPIRFLITKEKMSWEIAAEYRAYEWAGYQLGDPCFLLWGSSIDDSDRGLFKRISKRVERIVTCDAWLLSDDALAGFTAKAVKFRPEIVRGYANAVFMFAKYCQENHVMGIRPRAIITSAEKLTDSRRRVIEDTFGAKVFDHYGSREVGAIASECEEHNGYHISAENVVVEFTRDGETKSPGEEGAIMVTSLRNYGMPFLRYQIGDVGKASNDLCPCGRGLPLMASIEGRLSDFLSIYDRKSGKIVPYMVGAPGFVGAIFMHVPVDSYRVIQESLDRVRIQVVKGRSYSEKDTEFVKNSVRKFLGDNCEVEFEFMDNIPPLKSGKRSTFTSKIDPWGSEG